MTKLNDKIKTALDESRMLILGAQILLGFQFRGVFERGFGELPATSQYLKLISLGVLLIFIALIMWPGAYHRMVRQGNDSVDVHDFTTRVMDVALLPFMVSLAIEFYAMTGKLLGEARAIIVAALTGATALFLWYGLGLIGRFRGWDNGIKPRQTRTESQEMAQTKLHDKVEQVLVEARVVLPGAQALMGFQFATMLVEGFDKLPDVSKGIHLISLLLMGVTVVLLMTPAAYHRIVERGEDTEHFHRVASILLLAAMIPLPLGICGDLYVVVLKVTSSTSIAVASALSFLILFYGLWFGYTAYRRVRLHGNSGVTPGN